MQGNAALKTGLLSFVLLLAGLYPSITGSSDNATLPHTAAQISTPALAASGIRPSLEHPDIRPVHKHIAEETLSALPQSCVSTLESLYVRYDKPKSRGLAGKSSIILDGTVSNREFRALFIHEFGHIVDIGCLIGTVSAGPSAFRDGSDIIFKDDPSINFYTFSWLNDQRRRPDARAEDFVSGYAASDPFEDFAETFAYFFLQRHTFRRRAATNIVLSKKYNWMRDHFEFTLQATGQHQWDGTIPWDVTKLPYIWHKQTIATKPLQQS